MPNYFFDSNNAFPEGASESDITEVIATINAQLQDTNVPLVVRNFHFAYMYSILTNSDVINKSNFFHHIVDRADETQKAAILQSLVVPN